MFVWNKVLQKTWCSRVKKIIICKPFPDRICLNGMKLLICLMNDDFIINLFINLFLWMQINGTNIECRHVYEWKFNVYVKDEEVGS